MLAWALSRNGIVRSVRLITLPDNVVADADQPCIQPVPLLWAFLMTMSTAWLSRSGLHVIVTREVCGVAAAALACPAAQSTSRRPEMANAAALAGMAGGPGRLIIMAMGAAIPRRSPAKR